MTDVSAPLHEPAEQHRAYRRTREDITALLARHAWPAQAGVPACPGWDVRDLIGHLVHICHSFIAGEESQIDLEPVAGLGLAPLLGQWAAADAAVGEALRRTPELRRRIVLLDVFSHEVDLLTCFGEPPAVDHPAFAGSLDLATMGFDLAVHGGGLPALRIVTPERDWVVGAGEPAASVRGPQLDVFRSLTGRRTWRQIERLDWSGAPPATWVRAFTWGPFSPPDREVDPVRGS
ncbi:hypothetical protein ACIQGZ_23075 [Streptomyces sp. NPDC092296]|uniref:hypothetical protein n=1 Tax=Streptomyces sp. NPDC092296 TaxID=3366012 RepID=UPI0038130015